METHGRRTRIRPGREADYARVHATIPATVEAALRNCGVLRWHIWMDGSTLFHSIETTEGYNRFVEVISALGPVDPSWDAIIADLLDPDPASDRVLPLVWAMDADGQGPGPR